MLTISLLFNGMFLFIIIFLLFYVLHVRNRLVKYNERFVLVSISYTYGHETTVMKYTDSLEFGLQELVVESHWDSKLCHKHFESMNRFHSEHPGT